ncbi:MAG: flagellar hook-length control protein FliK [Halioglobus sp.]
MLLAESSSSSAHADAFGAGGNRLPQGGNDLPISAALESAELTALTELDAPVLNEFDLFTQAAAEVDTTQTLTNEASSPEALLGQSAEDSLLSLVESEGAQQAPAVGPALLAERELPLTPLEPVAEVIAPVSPAILSEAESPAPSLATGVAGAGPEPSAILQTNGASLPLVEESATALQPRSVLQSATQDNAETAFLGGLGASRVQPGAADTVSSGLTVDRTNLSSRNGLGEAAFATPQQQPVTLADEVLLESVDAFQALDASRANASAALTSNQSSAPQPLAGLAAPTALDATSAASKVVTLQPLSAGLSEPEWNTEIAGRVAMMLKNGAHEASLQLNPPELGRLDIRIATEGDQARVTFAVHNAEARDVIENNMPRLRELLEQGGMQLARSDVADYSQNGQGSDASDIGDFAARSDGSEEDGEAVGVALDLSTGAVLDARVDYYV